MTLGRMAFTLMTGFRKLCSVAFINKIHQLTFCRMTLTIRAFGEMILSRMIYVNRTLSRITFH